MLNLFILYTKLHLIDFILGMVGIFIGLVYILCFYKQPHEISIKPLDNKDYKNCIVLQDDDTYEIKEIKR